jgi:hypothetical protein
LDGATEVACHKRSWERGSQIENPEHIKKLEEYKKAASQHRGMDRLRHAAPSSRKMMQIAALEGKNLGGLTIGLLKLLNLYGATELEHAVQEAVEFEAGHMSAVRQILERRRREQNLPPPVEIALPNDPRIRDIVVVPHSLSGYDLAPKELEEESSNE